MSSPFSFQVPPVPVLLFSVLLPVCVDVSRAQYSRAFNAGGKAIVAGGVLFEEDQPYDPPATRAGFVDGRVLAGFSRAAVGGGEPVDLYRLSRAGLTAYRFDCADGFHVVTLGFAEVSEDWKTGKGGGAGLRTFTVSAEGKVVLSDLDIAAEAGNDYALRIRFVTEVKDGRLDVEFTPGLEEAILASIQVLQRSPDSSPPQMPGHFQVRPGFGRNILSWNPPMDTDFEGVHVLRAPRGSATFTTLLTSRVLPAFALDPSAEAGKPYDYKLAPFDVYGNAAAPTPAVSSTARDLEAPGIRNYHITIDPEALKVLNSNAWLDVKVPALFTYRGKSFPVRVRYRGSFSRHVAKKNWKVDFGSPVFEGRRQLNLQGEFMDNTCIRERVAYDLFDALDILSPKARFVHLTMNGETLGLYTDVEQVDEGFLEINDRDGGGTIYQAQLGTLHLESSPEQYRLHYEKETNKDEGYEDLIAFIDRINNTSNADFPGAIAEVLDIDSYLSYWALLIWVSSWDSVQVNYFVVHDKVLDRWQVVPWDQDTTFSNYDFSYNFITWPPLCYGTRSCPQGAPPNLVYNQLLTRVMDVAVFRWKFLEKLEALSTGLCLPASLAGRIDAIAAEARAVGEADVLKYGWEDNTVFRGGPAFLKAFGPKRITYLNGLIPGYRPPSGPGVVVNEVMADNEKTIKDEAGDFEDWIELFNPGRTAVDVSGMYLTDALDRPMKWKIPAGTTIASGGRLLVWADDEPAEGKLHATFKLSNSGEQVALFDTDGRTLVDVIHFNRLDSDLTWCRTSDGHAFFMLSGIPTPGTPNRIGGDLPPRLSCDHRMPNAPGPGEGAVVTVRAEDDRGIQFVQLFYRTGGGFQQASLFDDGKHGDGFADDGLYGTLLPGFPARTRVDYYFRALDTGGREVMKPRAAPGTTRTYRVYSPGASTSLRIHEFVAENRTGIRDEQGEYEDWIEVVNPGNAPVDAGGLFLTDDLTRPIKWSLPPNTLIPPGGTFLVWADNEPLEGSSHATFRLSAGGEEVGLFDRDGVTLLDRVVFGGQFADMSTGRLPSVFDVRVTFPDPTPRAMNSPAASGGYLKYCGLVPGPARPTLTGTGTPRIGGKAVFLVDEAPPSIASWLGISMFPLHETVPGVGTVLVHALGLYFTPVVTTPQGKAIIEMQVPNSPALSGFHLFGQMLTFAGHTPMLSNGLLVRIGP